MDPFQDVVRLKQDRFHELFQKYGLDMGAQQITGAWIQANKNVSYPHICHFCQEEAIVHEVLRDLGVSSRILATLGLDLLVEYRSGLRSLIERDARTTEVQDVLRALRERGKRLGVFSNDRIMGLATVLEYMNIEEEFEYIQTSEAIGIEKPDPRVFDDVIQHFRLPPAEIVYVGDDPAKDVDPAKERGLQVILHQVDQDKYSEPWRNYHTETKHKPDAVIKSLGELTALIE